MRVKLRTLLRKNHFLLWLPVVLYYCVIFGLSAWEHPDTPDLFSGFDKGVHFFEFALFGALIARSLSWEGYLHHLRKWGWPVAILVLPALAGLDELHQYFVPGREVDLVDWVADVLGGFAGMVICWRIYRHRFRVASPPFL